MNRVFASAITAVFLGCTSSHRGGSGAGGMSSSSGGSPGSGGATSTGGNGSGGTGAGGTSASGGATGTGGVTATGGTVGPGTGGGGSTGGAAGRGGVSGSGGAAGARATGGSSGGGSTGTCGGGSASAGDVTIQLSSFEQTMDGFGVSNTYQSTAITDATADQFFDPNKGIGLSIFRLGIKSDGTSSGPLSDAQKAAARGAIVWAAPWTPPANCKSNNSLDNGGSLNTGACYDSWSSTLAAFPALAKKSGVTVVGISAQNEPDNMTMYESCLYTGAQMVSFIKTLGPKLKALSPPVKLLAPESTRWERLWGADEDYGDAILADSQAAAQVDILATHMYETQDAVAPPAGVAKPIWVTEMSGVMGYPEAGPSSDIADGLVWAGWIHAAFTTGRASAWHAWWMTSLNNDNEGLLLMGGGTTKRLYTVGNYSKFIRPGYQRVDVSGTPPANVQLTAYTNTADGTVVVVAINNGTSAVALPLYLSGQTPCSLIPWVTSASDNLAAKTPVSVSGARLAPMLAAQSVTTLVGKP